MTEQPSFASLNAQADFVESHGLTTLVVCTDAWALRHRFLSAETGEVIRARCNSWRCLYCGPRKVDQWRQLVRAAEPTLFLTLTKSGYTVEECARALTTFLQYLRRGSKGRGPHHVGAREAYPVEYFAVLERHEDFERVGFHWHLLLRGVDYVPHEILKEGWRSATHGASYIVHIEAIRKPQVIGYVTKYLLKTLSSEEKGARMVERSRPVYKQDESGKLVEVMEVQTERMVSAARRIRYSRGFFPESVADLRARLFAQNGDESGMEAVTDDSHGLLIEQKEQEEQPVSRGGWVLFEQEAVSEQFREDVLRWRRKVLLEKLEDEHVGQLHLSRRVISMWAYQRKAREEGC